MRVVIDTNVWVSGLLWQGMPWSLLCLAEAGKVELCVAPAMLVELAEVLSYERLRPRLEQLQLTPAELVAYAINLASVFDVSEGAPIVADDPDDDVFLRCASVAGADYVVSGDRHLLNFSEYAGIRILTDREFLARFFPDHVD
ncbi:MAG: putative toxin-antitoxin system toxin component, PIN family [Anaerolineales bacterium]|nr:MAG: putative toxin-antitoxin system toxin component, PIN family [Anaerolineales bacterium]